MACIIRISVKMNLCGLIYKLRSVVQVTNQDFVSDISVISNVVAVMIVFNSSVFGGLIIVFIWFAVCVF